MGLSKTDQFGVRLLQVPVPRVPHSPLCPVMAFRSLINRVPASSDVSAFTFQTFPKVALSLSTGFFVFCGSFWVWPVIIQQCFQGIRLGEVGSPLIMQLGYQGI